MNGITVIKGLLEQSRMWFMVLIEDIKDAPTTSPTPKGGNHPLWVLGHVVHSEASLVSKFIQGKQSPLSKWDSLFGRGAEPTDDASKYPSMDEMFVEYEKVRADTLKLVDSLNDDDLDQPSHAPEDLRPIFGTVGQCLTMVALHASFHAGQVADARRALGRKPVVG